MITISIYGLDQYAVGHYSKENTKNLAQLFETNEDNILFYAPNSYLLHYGMDQTSWNSIVRINAPRKFAALETKVAEYILKTIVVYCINASVEFYYYEEKNRYEFINKEYPRFLSEENIVNVEHEEIDEEEIYHGNVFENLDEKIEEEIIRRNKNEKDN